MRLLRDKVLIIALLLAITTFVTYIPALNNDFVNWDDPTYVYENPHILSINLEFLKKAFTSPYFYNWHPLTMLSYALDYAVWGLNPAGYHFTNILFHTANTLLVFVLAVRLIDCGMRSNPPIPPLLKGGEIKSPPFGKGDSGGFTPNSRLRTPSFHLVAASVAALLFGIHPVHVESVAWVSERKDALCAFFFLLSLLLYIKYVFTKGLKPYVSSLAFFILALMSKPMAVSLPVVLLILDFHPLNRFRAGDEKIKNVLAEKLPFFLLSLLSSLITLWAQYSEGALKPLDIYPMTTRFFVAIWAFLFYLSKMLIPLDLATFYPYPSKITIVHIAALIVVSALTIYCILSFKKNRLLAAVCSYYIITLIPVIGIVQVAGFAAADRYTYLPSIGPFILAGIAAARLIEDYSRYRKAVVAALAGLALLGITITIKQIEVWKDPITLWSHEIKIYPAYYGSYYSRGNAYLKLNRYDEAISDYTKAVELNHRYIDAYNNRGNLYFNLGNYQSALSDYNRALELNPTDSQVHTNRGNVYFELDNYAQAIKDHNRAIEINPNDAKAYNNRGVVYLKLGNYDQAITDFNKAIELDPELVSAYDNLQIAYRQIEGGKDL